MTMKIVVIALGLQTTNSKNSKVGLKIGLMMKELCLCLSKILLHFDISRVLKKPHNMFCEA
jgi:hypothetical protein